MATPLWLAKIDSPSSGTVTTIVDSSSGTAVNLTCTSVTGTSIASGVGATFGSSSGAVSGSLSGTKIATALAGATNCTLEGEFDTTSDAGFMDMLGLQATSFDDFCSMFTGSAGASRVAISGCGGGVYFTVTPGRHRFLAVIDSTQATNTNRLILYVDGSPAAVDTGVAPSWPALNATIDAGFTNWANNRLAIGCLISAGVQSFQGPAYLAALYSSSLTSTDASAHNTAIAANNDADPNSTGVSVALTGLSATVSRGTPVPAVAPPLTGQSVTASKGFARAPLSGLQIAVSQGTLVPAVGSPLTGQSVTASRGTPVSAVAPLLSGQASTSSGGTMAPPAGPVSLTGQSATSSGGTMVPAVGVPVTGQFATSGRGTAVPAIAPPLVGQAATSARGTVTPAVATTLTGQSATVGRGTLSVAAPSTAPIWQALITEASGTAIGDTSTGTAINLTLGGSTGWTSNTGGVGYNFGNNASLAAVNASLGGSKLQTALAGATKCSVEFEVNLASLITGNIILYLGNNAVTGGVFLISCDGAGGIIISSADGAYEFAATSGLHVYLIEIDSSLAAGSRIKAKIDGTPQTMGVNTEMTSGVALDINCSTWSSNRLTMGGTNGSDSLNGSVFYAAIYAITGVVDHTAALIANNDAAPSSNITVALTGIAATISRGLLGVAASIGLIGQSSTSGQGSVSQGLGQPLTGQQLTTSVGSLSVSVSRAVTGIGASASQGTQSAAVATPLTGQSVNSGKGILTPPGAVIAALTGLFSTASGGTMSPSIGVALSGRSVATSVGSAIGAIARSLTGAAISAIGGLFTPVTPITQRKFLATSLVSADVSLSLVPSDQSRTLVEG